jgi:hypothetical protein
MRLPTDFLHSCRCSGFDVPSYDNVPTNEDFGKIDIRECGAGGQRIAEVVSKVIGDLPNPTLLVQKAEKDLIDLAVDGASQFREFSNRIESMNKRIKSIICESAEITEEVEKTMRDVTNVIGVIDELIEANRAVDSVLRHVKGRMLSEMRMSSILVFVIVCLVYGLWCVGRRLK